MRKTTQVWLFIALLLTLSGALIFAGAMTAINWDFTALSTVDYVTNTYEITEDFKYVVIQTSTANISLLPTTEDVCKIECYEEASLAHTVTVSNDTLWININDTRSWQDYINIGVGTPTVIKIYLPADSCKGIQISSGTGDITIENLTVRGLTAKLTTGDIFLSDLTCQTAMTLQGSTGDMILQNVTTHSLTSTAGTGDITLKNVIAQEKFDIIRSTGDVIFNACDAPEIKVEVTTGDVMGTLLSDKDFTTKTSTGDVSVPDTNSGGICDIKTSTGDIIISITE